jgi:Cu+-exporting ATPase
MTVDPASAAGSFDYQGQAYYFCNPSCLERFKAEPAAFVAAAGTTKPLTPKSVAAARAYVLSDGLGSAQG